MACLVTILQGLEESVVREHRTELPWFDRALRERQYKAVDGGPVPYEVRNLASAFTGVRPGLHGCLSYWQARSVGTPQVLDGAHLKAPFLWHWDELADVRFAVVNVQLTHPVYPIHGYLLSYPMEQTLKLSHPPQLQRELARAGLAYAADVSAFYTDAADRYAFLASLMAIARRQLDVALHLADHVDVLVFNVSLADRVSHFFWRDGGGDDAHASRTIVDAYRFIDSAMVELSRKAGEDEFELDFAEFGFGPIDGFFSLNQVFEELGLLRRMRSGQVDEGRSTLYEAVQGTHGVVVGAQRSAMQYREAVRLAEKVLGEIRAPDGTLYAEAIHHREDLYPGPWCHLFPDLIVVPRDPRRPPLGDPQVAGATHRHLQTGWHRSGGFALLRSEQGFRTDRNLALEDIAPTIAGLVGRQAPARCQGESHV